jgi:hypothetical protein
MDKASEDFADLRRNFPKSVRPRGNKEFFVGPQIVQLFEDHDCSTRLNAAERRAWETFGNV